MRKRARMEGRIEQTAKKSPSAALELARQGRVRSEVESALWSYLWGYEVFDKSPKSDRMALAPVFEGGMENCTMRLCMMFFDAVEKGDSDALRQMADELDRFQQTTKAHVRSKDPRREFLLHAKLYLEKKGQTITVRRLAELQRLSPTDDGNSQLRRLAKRLGVPLAKEPSGRPKNPDK
jgi:hypothetical protein